MKMRFSEASVNVTFFSDLFSGADHAHQIGLSGISRTETKGTVCR